MESWDEIRTAYHVAQRGTVSGAAEALGVHHATVIRHVDALEARLGVKLFQRHARGYTPTEAGEDLLRVAQATDEQFGQLLGRMKGRGADVSGELVLTSIVGLSPLLAPVLRDFQDRYPAVTLRYLTSERIFRLEYGEAHVAVRAGPAPEEPDNVVQPFLRQRMGLYAAPAYVAARGVPASLSALDGHRFVGHDGEMPRAPFDRWLQAEIPRGQVAFRSPDPRALEAAVLAGAGIGFLPPWTVAAHPELTEVAPPREAWTAPLWLVTHVDLHRSSKVQALLRALKAYAKGLEDA
ncbi:LysR family transcriptional regulator [Rhodosalinus sp. K401]|uniref:LysR family transcriptional regulator n=1 Tax=Rhodosalinus sp. K401 TaxID=3239195 RepID=UPI003526BBDF